MTCQLYLLVSISIFHVAELPSKNIPYIELPNIGLEKKQQWRLPFFWICIVNFQNSCMLVRKHCIYCTPYLQIVLCQPAVISEQKFKKSKLQITCLLSTYSSIQDHCIASHQTAHWIEKKFWKLSVTDRIIRSIYWPKYDPWMLE